MCKNKIDIFEIRSETLYGRNQKVCKYHLRVHEIQLHEDFNFSINYHGEPI